MDKRDVPSQWLPYMERANVTSARQISEKTGVSVQPVLDLLHGKGSSSKSTVDKVAALFGIPPGKVRELRGKPTGKPFELPPEADLLDEVERAAVRGVIKALLRQKTPAEEQPTRHLRAARVGTTAKQRGQDEKD